MKKKIVIFLVAILAAYVGLAQPTQKELKELYKDMNLNELREELWALENAKSQVPDAPDCSACEAEKLALADTIRVLHKMLGNNSPASTANSSSATAEKKKSSTSTTKKATAFKTVAEWKAWLQKGASKSQREVTLNYLALANQVDSIEIDRIDQYVDQTTIVIEGYYWNTSNFWPIQRLPLFADGDRELFKSKYGAECISVKGIPVILLSDGSFIGQQADKGRMPSFGGSSSVNQPVGFNGNQQVIVPPTPVGLIHTVGMTETEGSQLGEALAAMVAKELERQLKPVKEDLAHLKKGQEKGFSETTKTITTTIIVAIIIFFIFWLISFISQKNVKRELSDIRYQMSGEGH